MLIAEDTIDERMLDIQQMKEEMIQEVISLKALWDRDSIKKLLEYFGDVYELEDGGISVGVDLRSRNRRGENEKSQN